MRNGRLVFAEDEERLQGRTGGEVSESLRVGDPYETSTHMMPRLLADKAVLVSSSSLSSLALLPVASTLTLLKSCWRMRSHWILQTHMCTWWQLRSCMRDKSAGMISFMCLDFFLRLIQIGNLL